MLRSVCMDINLCNTGIQKWFEIDGDFIFRQQKILFHEIDDVHMHNKSGFALNSSDIFETTFFFQETLFTLEADDNYTY